MEMFKILCDQKDRYKWYSADIPNVSKIYLIPNLQSIYFLRIYFFCFQMSLYYIGIYILKLFFFSIFSNESWF